MKIIKKYKKHSLYTDKKELHGKGDDITIKKSLFE